MKTEFPRKFRRNERCYCGSGRKYKHCHGRVDGLPPPDMLEALRQRAKAREIVRITQQGHGRPIISTLVGDHRVIAAGNNLFHSNKWKTFPDFLVDYIKIKLDPEWGSIEIKKPLPQRHPIMQWYDAFCRQQQDAIKRPEAIQSMPVTGVVACFLGTAYSLYLLDHNVDLQERLIYRLKHPGQFQGAYYELLVAGILIRAGFDLILEDEVDNTCKHCEFAAVSKATKKRYWVEAKMRAVAGRLGRTSLDGGPDNKPLAKLIPHLNAALAKPAPDERLIFVDLNAPPSFDQDGRPSWLLPVITRLERFEREELAKNQTAYVFVTNFSEHRELDKPPKSASVPFGLGITDFNRPGEKTLGQVYREKRKHIDAHNIGAAIVQATAFPATFDGRPPSQAFSEPDGQIQIGDRYEFRQEDGESIVGTVDDVAVNLDSGTLSIVVGHGETSSILSRRMSDSEMQDYKVFGHAYFGKTSHSSVNGLNNEYELFEFLMSVNAEKSRESILKYFEKSNRISELQVMSDDDLRITYCEHLVWSIVNSNTKASAPAAGGS